ncbi:hypothetical protein KCU74_g133, partial [Aureobasidium melanogenum]
MLALNFVYGYGIKLLTGQKKWRIKMTMFLRFPLDWTRSMKGSACSSWVDGNGSCSAIVSRPMTGCAAGSGPQIPKISERLDSRLSIDILKLLSDFQSMMPNDGGVTVGLGFVDSCRSQDSEGRIEDRDYEAEDATLTVRKERKMRSRIEASKRSYGSTVAAVASLTSGRRASRRDKIRSAHDIQNPILALGIRCQRHRIAD